MFVDIDIGNTRLKWRLLSSEGHVVSRGAVMSESIHSQCDFDKVFSFQSFDSPPLVRVATVVSSFNEYLLYWAEKYGVSLFFAKTQREAVGVRNAYHDVSQMGVDRWLAMIAAYNQCFNQSSEARDDDHMLVVIDAGSALTMDIIASDGAHKGGYIVPGLTMMREGLLGSTEKVQFACENVASSDLDLSFGKSTQQAVLSGLPLMHVGFIQKVIDGLSSDTKRQVVVLITGGDGSYLKELLYQEGLKDVLYVPELVMDGLALSFV